MINAKDKAGVKMAQVFINLLLVFHKMKINILFLALGCLLDTCYIVSVSKNVDIIGKIAHMRRI